MGTLRRPIETESQGERKRRIALPLVTVLVGLALGAAVFSIWMSPTIGHRYFDSPLEFRDSNVSLGRVKVGDTKTCEFEFTNKATEPLTILSVKASCICSEVHWPEAIVAPNQSGIIQASLNTDGRRAPSELETELYVHYRIGNSPEEYAPIRLSVAATICDDVQISPPDLVINYDGRSTSSSELAIQRDSLDEPAFAKLQLRTPSCLRVREKHRSSDRIVFQLNLVPEHVGAESDSIGVEYGEDPRRIVVPVRINRIVRLIPNMWFTRVREKDLPDSKEAVCKRFNITSTRYGNVRVARVTGEEELFNRETVGTGFSLWLRRLPDKVLYLSLLRVSYIAEDEGKEIAGELILPVRILGE